MIKKLFIALIALLSLNIAQAQSAVGEWTVYNMFSTTVEKVIDTSSMVYYMSAGSLYSYDKDGGETYFYSTKNKLNDTSISDIYYNYDNKYLMVVYSNCNIDLLYDSGKVVNMSDINDAVLTTEKIINDVKFANNRIYIATNFGIVIYDDKKHEVVESGIYGQSIDYLEVVKDNLVINTKSNTYYSPLNIRHNTLSKFTQMFGLTCQGIKNLGDKVLFAATSNSTKIARVYTLDFENEKYTFEALDITAYGDILDCKNGNVYVCTSSNYYEIDSKGEIVNTVALPSSISGQTNSLWAGVNSVWTGGSDGIANIDITSSTILSDYYKPNALNCIEVAYIIGSNDGERIYMSNLGSNQNRTIGHSDDGLKVYETACMLSNDSFTDISLLNPKVTIFGSFLSKERIESPGKVIESPFDPTITYHISGFNGVYVVKYENGATKQIGNFTGSNAPFQHPYGCRVYDICFDEYGNLFVYTLITKTSYTALSMLPADKVKEDPTTIKKTDWVQYTISGQTTGKDLCILPCKGSNIIALTDTYSNMIIYDTNGTRNDTSDDKYKIWTNGSFVDQDGKSISFSYFLCMAEDNDGRVWVGTNQGIFEVTDPTKALDNNATFKRPKVPRNDGTNLADYLLSTDIINGIAVDASNCKWIATENSGVYRVSADGDSIMEQFTTANSFLPTNAVASVYCDKLSNTVYFGTSKGLVSYGSTASASTEDYSDVYAYPNPVRPDYTGWITVKGLMDNSLVKITDAMGNIVYETRSEGGMVVWDGCNSSGSRVSTGVYYVFASQSDGTTTKGAVTKILVVN